MISAGRVFCPSWKIYRRDFCPPVKKSGWDYVHVAKKIWEGLCPSLQKWAGGLCPGGILSYTRASTLNYIHGLSVSYDTVAWK